MLEGKGADFQKLQAAGTSSRDAFVLAHTDAATLVRLLRQGLERGDDISTLRSYIYLQ